MKDHPFFCHNKRCRKTAWDTPEYLTIEDWEQVGKYIEYLEANCKEAFDSVLYFRPSTRLVPLPEDYEERDFAFFNRIIGWPEGQRYYKNASSDFYFKMIARKDLPLLKKAVGENKEMIKKLWRDFLKK